MNMAKPGHSPEEPVSDNEPIPAANRRPDEADPLTDPQLNSVVGAGLPPIETGLGDITLPSELAKPLPIEPYNLGRLDTSSGDPDNRAVGTGGGGPSFGSLPKGSL